MNRKLYKYLGPNVIDLIFKKDGLCGLKCSYPKDYNDPYELFLSMDFNQTPDILAYYQESIGEIPQKPTTCFSNSPIVVPMWAHYAQNSEGFILEIDEDLLREKFDNLAIADVTYKDEADSQMVSFIQWARGTMKPRHTVRLWKAMMHTAYFTKQTCWSYEQERRIIANYDDIIDENENMILYVPRNCITAIITGSRASEESKLKGRELADSLSSNYYEMNISKTSSVLFFLDHTNRTYLFKNDRIELQKTSCATCNEPLQTEHEDTCSWCKITDEDIKLASESNPMNLLAATGKLEDYLKQMW